MYSTTYILFSKKNNPKTPKATKPMVPKHWVLTNPLTQSRVISIHKFDLN